jgi:tRNA-intron endonuclease
MFKITIYKEANRFFSNRKEAIALANESFFGELKEGKVIYSLFEVLYLLEKGKAEIIEDEKQINIKSLLKKIKNLEEYIVFKDLRNKGRVVKEGLKFGADFRVYDKGKKPGKDHASHLIFVTKDKSIIIREMTAKARIANTTNKSLLLAIVDNEEDVNYYQINWKNIS